LTGGTVKQQVQEPGPASRPSSLPAAAEPSVLIGLLSAQPLDVLLALQRSAGNVLARQLVASAPPRPRSRRGSAPHLGRVLARQHVRLISGRYVGDLEGAEANVREDVINVLHALHRLWSIDNATFTTEIANVRGRPAYSRLRPGDIAATIAALRTNEGQSIPREVAQALLGITLTNTVGAGRQNAKVDVYALQDALHSNWNLSNAAFGRERAAVNAGPDPVTNGDIPETLAGIARFKAAFAGGISRRSGPLAGTTIPAAQQSARREQALITPGAQTVTVTVGGVSTVQTAGFRDVVHVRGVNKSYRRDLWDETDALVNGWYPEANAMLARPRIAMSQFEAIGDAAKAQVDSIWGTYGAFGPRFHSGTNLLDASARPGISAGNLMRYLVNNQQELGVVRARHNADHSRSQEQQIVSDFMRDYIAHGSNRQRLEVVDRGWPALNAGGVVSIQPYEGATPSATRRIRWAAFQTMIHEYFHSLNHPNYYRYAGSLGEDQESVLVEGGASLMTDTTWRRIYPSRIRSSATLRAAVEGQPASFDSSVIPPIRERHYHPQLEQCRRIEQAFGPANFRAAFLTGRMDLIGYEMVGPRSAAGATATQRYTVPPTRVRTLADVAYQTQTSVEQLAGLNGLAVGASVQPGQTLLVRGRP
jgi:hypothetical protein